MCVSWEGVYRGVGVYLLFIYLLEHSGDFLAQRASNYFTPAIPEQSVIYSILSG
jgi:hypothetical protein